MIKKVIITLWILLAVMLLACVLVFTSISKGWIGYMPPVEDLENPNYKFATQVFSADGKTLGTYSYSKENRVYVGYQSTPSSPRKTCALPSIRASTPRPCSVPW